MADEPSPYQWDAWTYDVTTGGFSREDPTGRTLRTTIDILSNGRLSILGATVRDKGTGRIVWNIPTTRDFSVATTLSGRVLLSNATEYRGVNSSRLEVGGYAIGYSSQLVLPDGTVREYSSDYTAVTTLGERLAIDDSKIGNARYQYVSSAIDPITGQPRSLPANLRWATAEEAIERAIIGDLFDKKRALLDELTKLDLVDEFGQPLDNQSDVAAYLARIAAGSVVYRTIGFA